MVLLYHAKVLKYTLAWTFSVILRTVPYKLLGQGRMARMQSYRCISPAIPPAHVPTYSTGTVLVHVLSVEVGTVNGCPVHVHVYVHISFRSSLRINLIWEEMNDGFLGVEPHLNHHESSTGML
jgi:hypothetical protein